MFEETDPPDSYKKFKREVIDTIENTEVLEDEHGYPSALFLVNREEEGHIIYVKDLVDEAIEDDDDEPEEYDLEFIIGVALPLIVKKENSKYFAFVFSGEKTSDIAPNSQIVCILSGSAYETDMVYSEYSFEEGEAVLEPWEKDNIMSYPDLIGPFRRAITLQG